MTWDEFKKAVEAEGVQPDDIISYIDINSAPYKIEVTRGRFSSDHEGYYWIMVRG